MSGSERILVVDDNQAGRSLKGHILRRAGFDIQEAETGRRALEIIENGPIALAILDVKLPDMSGFDLCGAIKKSHPSIMVLQTSAAFVGREDRAAGLAGGADGYLIEPVDPVEFHATVESLLRRYRTESDLVRAVLQSDQRLAEVDAQLRTEMDQRAEAETMLRHAQKLDVLGQLTGGISHDFNNVLSIIMGNLESLRRKLDHDPVDMERIRYHADHAFYGVQRAINVTRHLIAFSRRQALDPVVLDINAVVRDLANMLHQVLGEGVNLKQRLSDGIWPVFADRGQLETAILNLAVNARDAMPMGGTLTFATSNVAREVAGVGGDYAVLRIVDTGVGMDKNVKKLAFEPFFTTKDVGYGTGLGLSQVHGFVKQSNGDVEIISELGKGAEIRIYLPRYSGPLTQRVADDESKEMPPSAPANTHVLVVEDDEHVRKHSVNVLRELGYITLEAETAGAAMDTLAAPNAVSIVLTNIGLKGGMNGIELGRHVASKYAHIAVIYTSAYAMDIVTKAGLGENDSFINKPFTFQEIGRVLAGALAGNRVGDILVVDDEPFVRMDLAESLGELGFKVHEAASVTEALDLLNQGALQFSALVTDLSLPDGRGDVLAETARLNRPDLSVVFTSGYNDPRKSDSRHDGKTTFIPKPFRSQDVAEALNRMGVHAN